MRADEGEKLPGTRRSIGKKEEEEQTHLEQCERSNGRAGGVQIMPTHNNKRQRMDWDQCHRQNPSIAEQHKRQKIQSLRRKAGYDLEAVGAERWGNGLQDIGQRS